MSHSVNATTLNLQRLAECEIEAFLNATAELLGSGSRWSAADAWLKTMDSLNWPNGNYQKFFRSVSIRTISQMVSKFEVDTSIASQRNSEEAHWRSAQQSAQ